MNNNLNLPATFAYVDESEMEEITGGASNISNMLWGLFSTINVGVTVGWNGTGIADGLIKNVPGADQNLAVQLVSWVIKTLSLSMKINLA